MYYPIIGERVSFKLLVHLAAITINLSKIKRSKVIIKSANKFENIVRMNTLITSRIQGYRRSKIREYSMRTAEFHC